MLTQEVKTETAVLEMFLLPFIGTQIHMCCKHEGDGKRRRDGGGRKGEAGARGREEKEGGGGRESHREQEIRKKSTERQQEVLSIYKPLPPLLIFIF